jgi:sec-independent protein translocase protein TatA
LAFAGRTAYIVKLEDESAARARASDAARGEGQMGSLSPVHWLIIGAIVLLLFGGRGKLSGLMGDAAKGIRAFRDGLKGDEPQTPAPPAQPLPRAEADKDPIVR